MSDQTSPFPSWEGDRGRGLLHRPSHFSAPSPRPSPTRAEGAWCQPPVVPARLCVFAFLFTFVQTVWAAPPQRIVCLAPSLTEMVFALGGGQRVVAVSDYCAGPAAALSLPRVGGFANPNYERILALRPDLVITIGEAQRLHRFCAARAIPCRALHIERLADVRLGLTDLGALLGRPAEAAAQIARLDAGLDAVREQVAGRRAIPTLLVVARAPGTLRGLMTTNGETFLSELLILAGGRNCFADGPRRYFTPSQEAILTAAPEVIVDLQPATDHWFADDRRPPVNDAQRHQLLADWRVLTSLPAVQNDRLYVVTDQRLLIPGLHLAETAATFAHLLHPHAMAGTPPR
jgi:iron complex transport system substrate-binding protein